MATLYLGFTWWLGFTYFLGPAVLCSKETFPKSLTWWWRLALIALGLLAPVLWPVLVIWFLWVTMRPGSGRGQQR